MKPVHVPVRVVGPGSQPDEEPLQYLDMPKQMDTFSMPIVPADADAAALASARELIARFADALGARVDAGSSEPVAVDLMGSDEATLEVVNQMLGEGEVSIKLAGARRALIQETVFAGVWRVCELDAGDRLVGDWIEASAIPRIVIETAHAAAREGPAPVTFGEGAMNSPALVAEIAERVAARQPGQEAHVVNLTLFPLSPEDHRALEEAVPVGPAAIISSGFGNCRVTSTLTRDVWRVQYFNNMNTLILNTIEIVDIPSVAVAAPEDLADSRTRMVELVAWMNE
ncbi:MAG: hydrogenase expression/formation C-terminal domain-containing protein [Burkholderiales bacterium]